MDEAAHALYVLKANLLKALAHSTRLTIIDCGGCDLRESNEEDCFGDESPRCGECLWAAGLVQCP